MTEKVHGRAYQALAGGAQVVSQLRSTQIVLSRNSTTRLQKNFARQPGVSTDLIIRGGEPKPVPMLAARLHVKAHGKRRFVVVLKYAGEDDYRFLVASDLSWCHIDIARLYSLRWLVEVCIQDWKKCGGWNRLSKQPGLPAGCLTERLKVKLLTEAIEDVVTADDPEQALKAFGSSLRATLPTRPFSKHMAGRDPGCLEPAPPLKYHAKVA